MSNKFGLSINLGTEFVQLCMLYSLLYGIDIFSDYLFLLEVTVRFVFVPFLKKKESLTNAFKLIVKISQ